MVAVRDVPGKLRSVASSDFGSSRSSYIVSVIHRSHKCRLDDLVKSWYSETYIEGLVCVASDFGMPQ
jgi:hypothetical protein